MLHQPLPNATGCTEEGAEIVTLVAIVMHFARARARTHALQTHLTPARLEKRAIKISDGRNVCRPLSSRITFDWCPAVWELHAIIYHRPRTRIVLSLEMCMFWSSSVYFPQHHKHAIHKINMRTENAAQSCFTYSLEIHENGMVWCEPWRCVKWLFVWWHVKRFPLLFVAIVFSLVVLFTTGWSGS